MTTTIDSNRNNTNEDDSYGNQLQQQDCYLEWSRQWKDFQNHDNDYQGNKSNQYHHNENIANENGRGRDCGAKNPSLSDSTNDNSTAKNDTTEVILVRPIAVRLVALKPIPAIIMREEQSSSSPLSLLSPFLEEDDGCLGYTNDSWNGPLSIPSWILPPPTVTLETIRDTLFHALACSKGDVDTPLVQEALLPLIQDFQRTNRDDPCSIHQMEGMWLTLSKPTYAGNLGDTPSGDPMYTLGRMAFDMFLPTQLVCSLQGNFNPVRVLDEEVQRKLFANCPKSLLEEIQQQSFDSQSLVRTYNIVTAFTIEPHQQEFAKAPNQLIRRPIMGIMTTYGFILPDPNVNNRWTIWFTGGKIQPNDDIEDKREWKRFFGTTTNLTPRTLGEKVKCLAANLLMGANPSSSMNSDGSMEFDFERPLGGHGVAYIDILYLDDTLRIVRGHRGTIFIFTRIPDTPTETHSESW